MHHFPIFPQLNGCDTNLTDKINLYSTIRAETKTPIWLELILSSTNNTHEIKKISSDLILKSLS